MLKEKYNLSLLFYCLIFILGFIWTSYIAVTSTGVPVHDEVAHFLISRHAWEHPEYLLSLWGRPIRNITYWIPAIWGLNAARLFSVIITGFAILIATQVGRLFKIDRLYLIPLFVWFQPWVSALSFAVLPQIPFNFLLVSGAYLTLRERYRSASLIFGLLPLTRHEGIAILGVWMLYLLIKRRWQALYAAILPLVAFNIIYFLVENEFAFNIYLDLTPTNRYGSGDWLHYIRPLLDEVGLVILTFSVISIVPILKSRHIRLFFMPYVTYLATHTIIYRYGLFASGGYSLFLLPLAPAFALAAVMGLEYSLSLLKKTLNTHTSVSRMNQITNCTIIVITAIVLYTGFQTRPLPLDHEGESIQQAVNWLDSNNIDRDGVIATHIWFNYFYDFLEQRENLPTNELPPGTIIVWDIHYSERNGFVYDQLVNSNGCWSKLESFGEGETVVLFMKSNDPLLCQE